MDKPVDFRTSLLVQYASEKQHDFAPLGKVHAVRLRTENGILLGLRTCSDRPRRQVLLKRQVPESDLVTPVNDDPTIHLFCNQECVSLLDQPSFVRFVAPFSRDGFGRPAPRHLQLAPVPVDVHRKRQLP